MSAKVRWSLVGVLLLVVACCMYLALAVPEASPDSWWAFWLIYTIVGLLSFAGASWLALSRRPRT